MSATDGNTSVGGGDRPDGSRATEEDGHAIDSPPSFRVVETSTERFGPVLVVKNDEGQVIHVEQSHAFDTTGNDLGSGMEAARTIAEIERHSTLVPQTDVGKSETPKSFKEEKTDDSNVEDTPKLPKPAVSFDRKTQEDRGSQTNLADMGVSPKASPKSESSSAAKRSNLFLQNTQRFGNVTVFKGETGKTIDIFPNVKPEDVVISNGEATASPSPQRGENAAEKQPDSEGPAKDEEQYMAILRKSSDLGPKEELYEFGNFKQMNIFMRTFYSMERDVYNWYGSFLSLLNHGWGFESFMTLFFAVGSTCFFCYYRTSDGTPLAARLDFSIIGSALVFPVTFLIGETFRRREGAIQRLASIKALLCQIELALLTWRWKGPTTDLGMEWEDRVHETLHHVINTMCAVLRLPTWNTNRHIYTAQGRDFKARVIKRERELTRRLGLLFSELHWYVEDLKESGLPANEASRINQYNAMLQTDFEALAMVKSYRTPNVSRSFVRIMVLVMPIFYGPYFAWVSGAIGSGAQTNVAFAIALTVVTVFVLLGLVRVQRSMEDPFTSHFPGDVIDLISEQLDTETRLNLIVACARERKRVRAAKVTPTSLNS